MVLMIKSIKYKVKNDIGDKGEDKMGEKEGVNVDDTL